jgi:hypothetical protein
MGLDMSAGWLESENDEPKVEFEWRKHARLQEYMRQLWYQKQGKEAPFGVMGCEFNCVDLYLDKADIVDLKNKITTYSLPEAKDGFFWGQQYQDEEMRASASYDLDFCDKALAWLDQGKKVWYSCWW